MCSCARVRLRAGVVGPRDRACTDGNLGRRESRGLADVPGGKPRLRAAARARVGRRRDEAVARRADDD